MAVHPREVKVGPVANGAGSPKPEMSGTAQIGSTRAHEQGGRTAIRPQFLGI
jgi:hypothetical protein